MSGSSRFLKRIQREVVENEKLTFESDGMMIRHNPSNINEAYAVVIGPEDTPYEKCFYFFKFDLSNNYPIQPPQGTYMTNARNIRFNPNLYVQGKICLSLLGTWDIPTWSPANNLFNVLTSIQGLVLHDLPLRNEPSHEFDSAERCAPYSQIVEHESLDTALTAELDSCPPVFKVFLPAMEEFFVRHIDFYIKKCEALKYKDGRTVRSDYGMSITFRYSSIEENIKRTYERITKSKWTPGDEFSKPPKKHSWD